MTPSKYLAGLGLAAAVMFGSGAHAAVIYSEATDGDLPGTTPPSLGTLGVGQHTVIGSTSFSNGVTDVDQFFIALESGLSGTYFITLNSATANPTSATFYLSFNSSVSGSFGELDASLVGAGPSELGTFTGGALFQAQFGAASGDVETGSIDYTYTFEVTDPNAVPLPGSLPLVALGLGALAGLRRRRQTSGAAQI